jgi:hypothetical protein
MLTTTAETDAVRDAARVFLASSFGITNYEIETVDAGRVVARMLPVREINRATVLSDSLTERRKIRSIG